MAENRVNVGFSDGVVYNNSHLKHKMDGQNLHQQQNQQHQNQQNSSPTTSSSSSSQHPVDRLKLLYPNVNEDETPLPRSWSSQDKCHSIGLSQNNLRVQYKGPGKSHTDAASVRTAYPIPAACGLYYFEVKIISKGKNGYMGIGLTSQNFKLNRLPGWDKQSYGYHGDDGNSFCSSGNGQPYGPTFTTGDVIGCGINLVNNTCFYTKNGLDLGIAFKDLPSKLYPTVGLQTPGEEVDANFGQERFKFDQIEDMIKQMRAATKATIYNFPMPNDQGDLTALLHKMVSSYLVHNGYSLTAESFAKTTGQNISEDLSSIKNRQKILKLIMAGRMGQAIEQTLRSYPGLLENNQNLLFMLKCRQFVEMVNGSDFETDLQQCAANSIKTVAGNPVPTSVIQSTKSYQNGSPQTTNTVIPEYIQDNQELKNNSTNCSPSDKNKISDSNNKSLDVELNNEINSHNNDYVNDVEMNENGHLSNGNTYKNGNNENNFVNSIDTDEDMEVDQPPPRKTSKSGVERMLEFGRELFQMSQRLEKENGVNETNQKMLEDAFSLLAYSNPWSSPLGWQLCPSRRETICAALNSAILESMNYSWRPPLEICVAHDYELLRLMANSSLGSCAFASVEDVFPQN